MTKEEKKAILKECNIFKNLDDDELSIVESKSDIKTFEKDEVIKREGEASNMFWVIHSGMVNIIKETQKKETFLCCLGKGAHFGEMSLLSGSKASATVISVEPTTAIVIKKEDFLSLVNTPTPLAHKILTAIIKQLIERLQTISGDFSAIMSVATMSQESIDMLVSTI